MLREKQERDGEAVGKNSQIISKRGKNDPFDDLDDADEIGDLEVKLRYVGIT